MSQAQLVFLVILPVQLARQVLFVQVVSILEKLELVQVVAVFVLQHTWISVEPVLYAIKHVQRVLVLQQVALPAIQSPRNECFQEHNAYVFPNFTMFITPHL